MFTRARMMIVERLSCRVAHAVGGDVAVRGAQAFECFGIAHKGLHPDLHPTIHAPPNALAAWTRPTKR
jgi:hypothetical protein